MLEEAFSDDNDVAYFQEKHFLITRKHGADVRFVGRGLAVHGAQNGDFFEIGDLGFSSGQGEGSCDVEAAIGGKSNLARSVDLSSDGDEFSDVGIGRDLEDVTGC